LKLFSVSVTSVSYLTGQDSIISARYGSIVTAVSTVTVLVLVFCRLSLVRNCECVLLSQSYSISLSQRSDEATWDWQKRL